MTKETIQPTDIFSSDKYEKLSPDEVDQLYDLLGPIGFHGFSCERFAPHFRKRPLSNKNENDTLKGA